MPLAGDYHLLIARASFLPKSPKGSSSHHRAQQSDPRFGFNSSILQKFFILGFVFFVGKTLLPKIYFWCSVFFNTHQYSFVFIRASQSLILCIIEYYVFFYALYSSRLCRNYQYSGTKVWRQKFWCAKKIDFWKDSAVHLCLCYQTSALSFFRFFGKIRSLGSVHSYFERARSSVQWNSVLGSENVFIANMM